MSRLECRALIAGSIRDLKRVMFLLRGFFSFFFHFISNLILFQ